MVTEKYKTTHFQAERHDRFVITVVIIVILHIFAYKGYLDPKAVLFPVFVCCSQLVANYFSSVNLDLFPHVTNALFAVTPYFILRSSSAEIGFATLLSLCNAASIGFEQRSFLFRVPYTAILVTSWIAISKNKETFNFDECISQNLDHGIKILIFAIVVLMMVAASHSDLEIKALKAVENALLDLREVNAKYEQTNKKLQELLEEKDNFILLFSHETRNPLNILMGNLSILLTECESPRQRERIIRSKFCAELLLHNLNNILDTGKLLNKGALELAPTIVNLDQYVHSIWDIIKTIAIKKQLKPTLIVPETLPPLVKVDAQKVTQIILNLVSNSVKFTASGSVSLSISYLQKTELAEEDLLPTSVFGASLIENETESSVLSELGEVHTRIKLSHMKELTRELKANSQRKSQYLPDSKGVGFLKFEVVDTGCGIKEEDIQKLFQKFSQVNSDASQRQLGSGLGLWISKTLAELLGGDIRVYSKHKFGTNFVVILRADYTTEQSVQSHSQSIDFQKLFSQRILLVDDDPYNLEAHFQMLKTLGFTQIDLANDGQELINLFKKKPEDCYQLILTDINMPKVNGIDAVRSVRQFEKETKRKRQVKIGFVTGHSNSKDKLLCEGAGIDAAFYLSKPLKISTLQGTLQELGFYRNIKRANTTPEQSIEISSRGKPLVLCVNDDILELEIFEDLLGQLGVRTIRAISGKEAISLINSDFASGKKINMVLIDCLLRETDGWTSSAEIKKITNIPVVGVTGADVKKYQEKFKASGMNEIVRKPVQRVELINLLIKYRLLK